MAAQKKTGTRGPKKAEPISPPRSGKVAVVGRPNVGKSTFLNAALDTPLAIVSPTPQTTRDVLLGVRKHESAEILLLDTPGFHKPNDALGRAMNRSARGAALDADVIVFITDLPPHPKRTLAVHPGDRTLLEDIGKDLPTILVVNKVDRLKDKATLLPLLQALSALRQFAAVIPISARKSDGVTRVLDEVVRHLPEGEHRFGQDDLTDRPMRFFAAEYVREQILLKAYEEVPHATCVTIDSFDTKKTLVRIAATIHVEKEGQKAILIGKKGEKLKTIGEQARLRIEELLGAKVFLEMFVKVSPAWRMSSAMLSELGLTESRSERSEFDLGGEEDREVSL